MTQSQLRPPKPQTLRRYGLTEDLWYNLGDAQGWKCPVCLREFSESLRPVIDHEHVKGYKKMTAIKKRSYIRGLPCAYCNLRRLPKGSKDLSPLEIAYNIYQYYEDYSLRSEK